MWEKFLIITWKMFFYSCKEHFFIVARKFFYSCEEKFFIVAIFFIVVIFLYKCPNMVQADDFFLCLREKMFLYKCPNPLQANEFFFYGG